MSRREMYYIDIRHEGLKKFRRVKGTDHVVVEETAEKQLETWEAQWQRNLEAEAKRADREKAAQENQAKKDLAVERSREAEEEIVAVESILAHTLTVDDSIDWDVLKRHEPFEEQQPTKPELESSPKKPDPQDHTYKPKLSLFDKILSSRRENKESLARQQFEQDLRKWEEQSRQIQEANEAKEKKYQKDLADWDKRRTAFLADQANHNQRIDQHRAAYERKEPDAITEYCELVLSNSQYPDPFPAEYEVDYNPETQAVIVDYQLPSLEAIPRIKEVKYVQSKDEFKESYLPDSAINKLYDSVVYQIALRTVHELIEADQVDGIESVVFNGWVRSIDKSIGNETNGCIVSLQTTKPEFLKINLAHVDPKACFKSLKGIGSSKLHSLTPVAPIMQIDRSDKRFVSSYDVADELDQSTNLAAMDWEDFEHLIREVFEKEFAQGGGEVKVTQASRDGGVDAVAFDPDPIRGGKIVIQAKRYTSTVGVAAVRDLYGTVLNEGATKGILVTTSDYGPDAYAFAKGKPLSLLSGANLLHLLQRHGHKAKIDLKEAKQRLAEKGR